MTPFVDTHCHIDTYEEQAKEPFESLWNRMSPRPEALIHVACDPAGFDTARILSEKYPFIHAAYGIHPEYVSSETPDDENRLQECLCHPRAIACGEFGLDYHYDKEHRKEQRILFERHLQLGLNAGKPLVLHLREADEDALSILRNAAITGTKIHVHCFTGSPEFAAALLQLSAQVYIGFTGIITFKNAQNVRDAAGVVPLERLLLETDAPYLAPVPHRGEPAHSGMIPLIAEQLAKVKGTNQEALMAACRENTRIFYGI